MIKVINGKDFIVNYTKNLYFFNHLSFIIKVINEEDFIVSLYNIYIYFLIIYYKSNKW